MKKPGHFSSNYGSQRGRKEQQSKSVLTEKYFTLGESNLTHKEDIIDFPIALSYKKENKKPVTQGSSQKLKEVEK